MPTWLVLKTLSYDEASENRWQLFLYKCRACYKKYMLLYRIAEIPLQIYKLLSLLTYFNIKVWPRPLKPCMPSACPCCVMVQKLQCYPAPRLASQLQTLHNSSLQIKVSANKTKQPFYMNANGWRMRKSSYNSHIHQNRNFIGVICQQKWHHAVLGQYMLENDYF